jgi:DNA-binding PadR family transcriptional regulator
VRNLEESGYLRKTEVKERPGGIANYYKLTPKTHLAIFFSKTNIEDLLTKINDAQAMTILETLITATTQPDLV